MLKTGVNMIIIALSLSLTITHVSCQGSSEDAYEVTTPVEKVKYKLPKIDLSIWKVTLPIGNPREVLPPEILDYATNETLMPFMYNDSIEGALVFYTYSRNELRELMNNEDKVETNWTFTDILKGTLAVTDGKKRWKLSPFYHHADSWQVNK